MLKNVGIQKNDAPVFWSALQDTCFGESPD